MKEISLSSTPFHATLYPSGGLLTRMAETEVESGRFRIIIKELSDSFNEDSLRVKTQGTTMLTLLDFRIQKEEVKYKVSKEKMKPIREQITALEKEIAKTEFEILGLGEELESLQRLSAFTNQKQSLKLFQGEANPASWHENLGFIRERSRSIRNERFELELEKAELEKKKADLEHSINQLTKPKDSVYRELILDFEGRDKGKLQIAVSYFLESNECSWKPVYEARTDSHEQEVSLSYFAQIRQSTGEKWDNIHLDLSTAQAQKSTDPPKLKPWRIIKDGADKYGKNSKPEGYNYKNDGEAVKGSVILSGFDGMMQEADVSKPLHGSTVTFHPQGGKTISGNGDKNKVLIMQKTFPSEFVYFSVPRLSEYVYPQCEVRNNSDYLLLAGEIRLFLDGTFIGKGQIEKAVPTSEKFLLSLGKDESVSAERILLRKEVDEKGLLFAKEYKITFEYLIRLKNTKQIDIKVKVWDQLPVAWDSKIKVENVNIKPVEYEGKDPERIPLGTIEWLEKLTAGEEKEFRFSFDLVYPKDMSIIY